MTPIANTENLLMRILQPADWSKPRGFSHGVALDGPGRWIVLAGQTGGDGQGDYQPDMAADGGGAVRPVAEARVEGRGGAPHNVPVSLEFRHRHAYHGAS